jgi:hypothetical protein
MGKGRFRLSLPSNSPRGRCTLHGASTVASVKFLRAVANPARSDLSIDRPPFIEHPFCFSSARRRTAIIPVPKPAAAPMKNKKEDILRANSINRPPLTGLEHVKTADRSGKSWHFLSAFCTSHDACKVERGRAHSAVVAYLPACAVTLKAVTALSASRAFRRNNSRTKLSALQA